MECIYINFQVCLTNSTKELKIYSYNYTFLFIFFFYVNSILLIQMGNFT